MAVCKIANLDTIRRLRLHHLCGSVFHLNWRTVILVDRLLNLALSHGFSSMPTHNRHLCKLLFKGCYYKSMFWLIDWLIDWWISFTTCSDMLCHVFVTYNIMSLWCAAAGSDSYECGRTSAIRYLGSDSSASVMMGLTQNSVQNSAESQAAGWPQQRTSFNCPQVPASLETYQRVSW